MMPIADQILAYVTLVGHRDVQSAVVAIMGPYHLNSTLHWCHCSSCNFEGLKNSLRKSRPVNYYLTFDRVVMLNVNLI